MGRCLTGAKFTMLADVYRQTASDKTTTGDLGTHELLYNDITGSVDRKWKPVVQESDEQTAFSIKCQGNPIVNKGSTIGRSTNEKFMSGEYEQSDYIYLTYPASYTLSNRDRITNVRNAITNKVIWVDEEKDADESGIFPSTVFEIIGITPIVDLFGNHIENRALLGRADRE